MIRLRPAIVLPAILALNAAIWAISLASAPGPWPVQHTLAEFLSTSALIIMSTNMIIATRPRLLESLSGGLDKLFASHRFDGLVAASLITSHFLLMPESAGWVLSKIFGYPTITLIVLSALIPIAPRSPWRRLVPLRYQDWKLEHRFMGVFVAAGVTHSLLAHPFVLELPLLRMWVYGVAALGLIAYAYREILERVVKERHLYRVGEPQHLQGGVLDVPLAAERAPFAYAPGQFAFVRFEGGPTREQHPFTISQHPSLGGLRFSVKASGDYTLDLQTHLAAGSVARIEGPYGRFDYRSGGRRQLWLAGGIGITPFLSFMRDVGPDYDVRFVWTVRNGADASYRSEIEQALTQRRNVRFSVHATNTAGHLRLADLGLDDAAALSVYICGPVAMRDAFIEQLRAMGVAKKQIHYEEFSLR